MRRAGLAAALLAFGFAACSRGSGTLHPGPAPSASAEGGRSPGEIRRDGNHLVGAGSLYLHQHAHNPVDWYPWGDEALARAKEQDRPIFLSIGYSSCHWCHVMEEEIFQQDDVAELLNARFVSIKVDREERPDLDATYLEALERLTGSGGWPANLFLTPSLRPFFGATYLPHTRFLEVARAALAKFTGARSEVESRGADVARAIAAEPATVEAPPLKIEDVHAAAARALEAVDRAWGGFGGRTKFPLPVRWSFLLHAYRKWGDPPLASALRTTLDSMGRGGIHDHVDGGFFRYATEPTWTVPHFEKMLYDNAQLASLYAEAYVALGDALWREVATDTLDFLVNRMRTDEGAFAASFDADSGGREGAFYVWTPAGLAAVAGESDGKALALLLGVTDAGNFEGASVITRRAAVKDVAATTARAEAEVAALWAAWRPKLREARDKRTAPVRDAKVVTAWNGLAIGALAKGYALTGDARYREAARIAASFLWRAHRRADGTLSRASNAGRSEGEGVLDDYAFFATGLLDLFEATGDLESLDHASKLVSDATRLFGSTSGGWFMTTDAAPGPLGRRVEVRDDVTASGASAMIGLLVRLSAIAGRTDQDETARHALDASAAAMRDAGLEMAGWYDARLLEEGPFYEVIVAGSPDAVSTRALDGAWRAGLFPWVVGASVPPEGPAPEMLALVPPAGGKHGRGAAPLAYVCVRGTCKAPTGDPARVKAELLAGWTK